ncbi:MAG TPA: hypothetical protein VLV78_07140 [Thermoanaerobaculia bacterium]|nr:hypothetical protein [Thermoanaerobaculia bacterium]
MRKATLFLAVLLLASCSSLGDLGSIFGSPSPTTSSSVIGTVTGIDTSAQRIDLSVNTVNNLRPSSTQTTGSVYYDSNTRVVYQGQTYNVTDLERGDEVSVVGANNNGRYIASTVTVTRNVRG